MAFGFLSERQRFPHELLRVVGVAEPVTCLVLGDQGRPQVVGGHAVAYRRLELFGLISVCPPFGADLGGQKEPRYISVARGVESRVLEGVAQRSVGLNLRVHRRVGPKPPSRSTSSFTPA